ncbi:MAG: hypothetical protein N4A72_06245 [Bacteroidales bacterium]|jgi:lysozyme family protein|nr:hypothetical protein [Bacteroidales bacterium]
MANFEIAYSETSMIEGGYVNDPEDNGKETYRGVSRKYHPNWKGWAIVDSYKPLKRGVFINDSALDTLVFEFYRTEFWDKLKCGQINSQDIADELYDTAVNMGVKPAVKILQEAINLLIPGDIKVDGIIGVQTLRTVKFIEKSIGKMALLKTMNGLQFMKYVQICEQTPSQEKFFRGWLKRV